jgi:fused signal recognition particle receptor
MTGNWLSKLKSGLEKTTNRLTSGISGALSGRKLDQKTLDALEETLIIGDIGFSTSSKLIGALKSERFNSEVEERDVREYLAGKIADILRPVTKPLSTDPSNKPHVVLVVGVNGSGKTTTIGKLAKILCSEGKTVTLAAGDTFRAAAIDQLKIWGERTGSEIVSKEPGSDPAGLAFDALEIAKKGGSDVLLIDTAGRLQNRQDLMAEIEKIVRVLRKIDPSAPHNCLLVLDATVGQNAHSQVENFQKIAEVTGLIMTKMDGTARGGVVVALAETFGLPVHAIGIGEGEDDLRPFSAEEFAQSLLGLS